MMTGLIFYNKMKKSTSILSRRFQRPDAYGAISMPVYNAVAYEFEDADQMADTFCGKTDSPDYSRVTNPTVTFLEKQIRELAGAHEVTALNSGMAAISGALVATAEAGKTIVSSKHMFGNTYLLVNNTLSRFGVKSLLLDLAEPETVEREWPEDACCIFLETVTNPQLEVADIRALSRIAHKYNVPLIADTTMVPFTLYAGKELGIDIEVVSSTKYLTAGATCLGGLIIDYGNFPEISKRIKGDVLFNLGAYMTPHAAYMHLLGLETLEIRYGRQESTALYLAKRLSESSNITAVNYPGLESNRFYERIKELYNGYGAMLTIQLPSEEACKRFINGLQIVRRATNLFDNKSLAIHPFSTIFGPLPREKRLEMDVDPCSIRLSCGLEDPDDLLEDILQAADKAINP